MTIEDHNNPIDYGKTHEFNASTFEEGIEALYQEVVLGKEKTA